MLVISKEFVYFIYIIEPIGIELFIVPCYPFNVCKVRSDVLSFMSDDGNLFSLFFSLISLARG